MVNAKRSASIQRLVVCALMFGALTLAAGCSSMGSSPASSAPSKAVLITAGNGTTYVMIPTSDGKGVQTLSTTGKPETCEKCKADAIKAFNGESIAPVCDKCGATRTLLQMPAQ
jgi:hypothetical protein